jgi:hypothetical protein
MDQDRRNEILSLCLNVTGQFEGAGPTIRWDNIAGDFDDQGMSVGVLQFAALQGSLGQLCAAMLEAAAETSPLPLLVEDITTLSKLSGPDAKAFVHAHYLDEHGNVTNEAKDKWGVVLRSAPGVHAQMELADKKYFEKAISMAAKYVPSDSENARVLAFFFDIATQSGSMENKSGAVQPIGCAGEAAYNEAIAFADQNNQQTAAYWRSIVDAGDDLAKVLLHYAYKRAQLSRPAYVWDACSRRGTIACRGGVVHKHFFDFTSVLP